MKLASLMDEHDSRERTRTVLRAFLMVFIVYVAIGYANNTANDPQTLPATISPSGEPLVLGVPPTIPFSSEPVPANSALPAQGPALQTSPTLALTIIPPRPAAVVDGQTYTVQAGDNLFRIALRFGISPEALAQANAISDPSLIVVGQVLRIPAAATPSATPLSAAASLVVVLPITANQITRWMAL